MNKDTVVGILGAVILVAAMVAIFYYEGTQVPGGTGGAGGTGGTGGGNALYRTANATGPTASGQNTEEVTVDIAQQNLTAVEFLVTWQDDANTDPDTFRVTVTGPDGQNATGEGSDGAAGIPVRVSPIASVPSAANAPATTTGAGTWTISVELVSAGQVAGTPPLPVPSPVPVPGQDNGNAWDLSTSLTYFQRA